MKIVFITDTYLPEINGIVTSIDTFTKRLADRGHQVYIYCPKYDAKKDKKYKNITITRSISFSFITNKATKIAFPSIWGLMRDLKKVNPDVVHIHTPMNMGVSGLIAAKLMGFTVVQTYHTYIPDFMVYLSPRKLLNVPDFYSQMRDLNILKTIINSKTFKAIARTSKKLPFEKEFEKEVSEIANTTKKTSKRLSDSIAWNFSRVIYNKSDVVLTPSEALARILRRHRITPPVYFLSNGIDVNAFKKKESYKTTGKIIHIGRLGLEKNVDILIKAMAICLRANSNITLEICGDGPARKNLERLAVRLGVQNNVKFLGFVDNKFKVENYQSYDFFVTASCIETQGIVLLEAMSAGLPVIGPDILAVPDLIHDKVNGYLVKPRNSRDMAAKILLMIENQNRELMGKKSLETSDEHDINKCVLKLENIYKDLI